MKIENLKQLQQLITVMRKNGVESIKIDGIEFSLGNEPEKPQHKSKSEDLVASSVFEPGDIKIRMPIPDSIRDQVETETLTEDQLLYYSVGNE